MHTILDLGLQLGVLGVDACLLSGQLPAALVLFAQLLLLEQGKEKQYVTASKRTAMYGLNAEIRK